MFPKTVVFRDFLFDPLRRIMITTCDFRFSDRLQVPRKSLVSSRAPSPSFLRKELGDKFEIVFCSGDRDEDSLKEYFKHMRDEGGALTELA